MSLTRSQMLEKLYSGYTVKHRFFSDDEAIRMKVPGHVTTNEGYQYTVEQFLDSRAGGFWEDGWFIVEENNCVEE